MNINYNLLFNNGLTDYGILSVLVLS